MVSARAADVRGITMPAKKKASTKGSATTKTATKKTATSKKPVTKMDSGSKRAATATARA
jgi:hypothetical protein